MLGVDLQDRPQGAGGAVGVAEPVSHHLGGAVAEHQLARAVAGLLGFGVERCDQPLPALGALGRAGDRVERAEMLRLTLEDALVDGDRALRILEPILDDAAQAEEPGHRQRVARGAVNLALIELGQLAPAPVGGEEAAQFLERRLMLGVEAERASVGVGGLASPAEAALQQLADAVEDRGPLAGRGDGVGAARPHLDHPLEVVARLEEPDQRERGGAVGGIGLEGALVPRARAIGVAELLLVDASDSMRESRPSHRGPRPARPVGRGPTPRSRAGPRRGAGVPDRPAASADRGAARRPPRGSRRRPRCRPGASLGARPAWPGSRASRSGLGRGRAHGAARRPAPASASGSRSNA